MTDKLPIHLIPHSCWYKNARTKLGHWEWKIVASAVYRQDSHTCQACGATDTEVHAHEVFTYRRQFHFWPFPGFYRTQRLADIITLCAECHAATHLGRSSQFEDGHAARAQLMRVNRWNRRKLERKIAAATKKAKERNRYQWRLDISLAIDILKREGRR